MTYREFSSKEINKLTYCICTGHVSGVRHSACYCVESHLPTLWARIFQGLNQREWNERTEISVLINNLHLICMYLESAAYSQPIIKLNNVTAVMQVLMSWLHFFVIISYPEALTGDSPQPLSWKTGLVSTFSKEIIACFLEFQHRGLLRH